MLGSDDDNMAIIMRILIPRGLSEFLVDRHDPVLRSTLLRVLRSTLRRILRKMLPRVLRRMLVLLFDLLTQLIEIRRDLCHPARRHLRPVPKSMRTKIEIHPEAEERRLPIVIVVVIVILAMIIVRRRIEVSISTRFTPEAFLARGSFPRSVWLDWRPPTDSGLVILWRSNYVWTATRLHVIRFVVGSSIS